MEGYQGYKDAIIKLDSPRCVFYPGQIITGSLELELNSPLTFSVIYIKFIGKAIVHWTEQESETVNHQKRYLKVEYNSREEYLRGSELLAGSYGTVSTLNAGKYSYPFKYQLPIAIPSSFKGSRGAVKYYVSGHLEFEGKHLFGDAINKAFDVVAPFNLNLGNPAVREPIQLELEEVISCGCFGGDPVSVVVRVPFSAYCPGQVVPLDVTVQNNSSVEITSMIFELLTRSRYKSQQPVAEYIQPEEVLSTAERGSVLSGVRRDFQVGLRVPDLIAPNLELCSFIDVGYFLRVTVKVSGGNEDLQDEAEFCLGLIPLQETVEGTYTHPMAHSLPLGAPPDSCQADTRPEVKSNVTQSMTDNGNGFVEYNEQVITNSGNSMSVNIKTSRSYQVGFSDNSATNPGNTGSSYQIGFTTNSTNPGNTQATHGIPMKYFTPPGVYPYPAQNNAASITPSAPPL